MPHTGHRSLALAGLLWACLALPAAASSEAAPAPVRLAAPAHGASLQAGSVVELAWEPLAPFDRLGQSEEWEAFLSLDGGAHYTVRVTPHLDRDLRRVLWQVPATPTRDARLLLRFGNEREETAVELPQRFSIDGPVAHLPEAVPVRLALGRGEAALPGQPGVVAWVEGDRRGGSARSVVAAEPPSAQGSPSLAPGTGGTTALESASGPAFDPAAETSSRSAPLEPRRGSALPERTGPALSIPILLQSRRRNE